MSGSNQLIPVDDAISSVVKALMCLASAFIRFWPPSCCVLAQIWQQVLQDMRAIPNCRLCMVPADGCLWLKHVGGLDLLQMLAQQNRSLVPRLL